MKTLMFGFARLFGVFGFIAVPIIMITVILDFVQGGRDIDSAGMLVIILAILSALFVCCLKLISVKEFS